MIFKGKVKCNAKTVYAAGCTGLTQLEAPNAEYVDAAGCTGLTQLEAPNAEYVDAAGCTGLTQLEAPNAKTVYATGCTGLTQFEAPNAKTVDAAGCTGLTQFEAPNAKTVDAAGCTGLTQFMSGERLERLLTGDGKTVAEVASHWDCHEWSNCPMQAAFGATCISEVPAIFQADAALFISLFDDHLIAKPEVGLL